MIKTLGLIILATTLWGSHASAQTVRATWYQEGHHTANGERFNPDGMTVAHKTLKFGTKLRITHKGKSVIVRVNDRGPFRKGYALDLSRGVARKVGCTGTCTVDMVIVK